MRNSSIDIERARNKHGWVVVLDKKVALRQFAELNKAIRFARDYFRRNYERNYQIRISNEFN
ncbi:MAG: hypothetical protein MRY83_23715 [Flavobacteriales bacterium]|nr:hypothetical protein [Flavobacteriales bacterium]